MRTTSSIRSPFDIVKGVHRDPCDGLSGWHRLAGRLCDSGAVIFHIFSLSALVPISAPGAWSSFRPFWSSSCSFRPRGIMGLTGAPGFFLKRKLNCERSMSPRSREIQRWTKRLGGLCAISKCNVKVQTGHTHGIIGPNGAGKTTLFNLSPASTDRPRGYSLPGRKHCGHTAKPHRDKRDRTHASKHPALQNPDGAGKHPRSLRFPTSPFTAGGAFGDFASDAR